MAGRAWSDEERARLLRAAEIYDNQWALIAEHEEFGRSSASLNAQYYKLDEGGWEPPEDVDEGLLNAETDPEAIAIQIDREIKKHPNKRKSVPRALARHLPAEGLPSPSDIRRHASGEAVPGVLDEAPEFPDWERPEDVDWREWFDTWEASNEMHKRIDPTQEILTVDLSHKDEPIAVAFAADLHMGGGYTDHAAIRETIEYIIETPNLYVAVVGDTIEGFIPGSKSAETVEQMPASLKAQIAALKHLMAELGKRGKVLCMTWGDHDAKWFEYHIGVNVIKSSMHDQVPYFTGRGLINLKLGEQEYWVMVNHAERFNSQWNEVHPSRRQYERFFPADVNVTAHKHKPAWQTAWHYEQLREAGLNLGGKHHLIATGTFKTGPDPYTIRRWRKGILGVPTVVFEPDHHDSDCMESPRKAMRFMRPVADAA